MDTILQTMSIKYCKLCQPNIANYASLILKLSCRCFPYSLTIVFTTILRLFSLFICINFHNCPDLVFNISDISTNIRRQCTKCVAYVTEIDIIQGWPYHKSPNHHHAPTNTGLIRCLSISKFELLGYAGRVIYQLIYGGNARSA